MKTITIPIQEMHGGDSLPVALPELPALRPARRGCFWPGENFTISNRRLELADVLADTDSVRPELTGKPGPRL
jgi:hypothetical protein